MMMQQAKFGTHKDFQIYHNQSNSIIQDNGTNQFKNSELVETCSILTNTTETYENLYRKWRG